MLRRRQVLLSHSAGFSPLKLGSALKIWLDFSQQTDGGTLSIPDRMGGSPAVQAVAGQKPVVNTTTNGLTKLTFTDDCLLLPMSAPLNVANSMAIAAWIRPNGVATTASDLFDIASSFSGAASGNKVHIRQNLNDIQSFIWNNATDIRKGATNRGYLSTNVWKFMVWQFIGNAATEDLKNSFRDMGSDIARPQALTFSDAQNVVGPPGPTALQVGITGNAIIGARTAAGGSPFGGDMTDFFVLDPTLMTTDMWVQLAQYEVPIG